MTWHRSTPSTSTVCYSWRMADLDRYGVTSHLPCRYHQLDKKTCLQKKSQLTTIDLLELKLLFFIIISIATTNRWTRRISSISISWSLSSSALASSWSSSPSIICETDISSSAMQLAVNDIRSSVQSTLEAAEEAWKHSPEHRLVCMFWTMRGSFSTR